MNKSLRKYGDNFVEEILNEEKIALERRIDAAKFDRRACRAARAQAVDLFTCLIAQCGLVHRDTRQADPTRRAKSPCDLKRGEPFAIAFVSARARTKCVDAAAVFEVDNSKNKQTNRVYRICKTSGGVRRCARFRIADFSSDRMRALYFAYSAMTRMPRIFACSMISCIAPLL